MNFNLSPQQAVLRDDVRQFCLRNYTLAQRQALLRSAGGFSADNWRAWASNGWLGVMMPKELGGMGGSSIDMAIILEEFGRSLVLEPFLACAVLAPLTVDAAGTERQREAILPPVIHGETVLALAHEETGSGGEVQFVELRAESRGAGGYTLSGCKSLVLGGSCADVLVVSARTRGRTSDHDGVSLFLVSPDAPGLTMRTYRTVDGRSAADLTLRDVEVGADALLGAEGQAVPAIEKALDQTIVGICAEAVGAMDSVIATTCDFLKTRRAYGTTLSTFQALQHRLADMLTEFELSRSMLYRALAAATLTDTACRRKAISAAKALIGQSARFVAGNGIQLHGGIGMSDEYVVGHLFKRLAVVEKLFGDSSFHLMQASTSMANDLEYATPKLAARVA